jgi:uncharacterized protein
MAIKQITPELWQTQRWQNGGGITHQLARCDDDQGMRWRLSIAEVAVDGPFSRFENIERIILLLEGEGFCLHGVGDNPQVIDKTLQPFAFAGETDIDCKLIQGPVRDFNLMSRRHDVSASLEVLNINQGHMEVELSPHTLIYVAMGLLSAELMGESLQIEPQQTLCFSDEPGVLKLSSEICQLLLIKID